MVFQLVYCSKANHLFTSADLLALLELSREFNTTNSITGLLLYKDKSFVQLLEGEKSQVIALYKKIALDNRHRQVTCLIEKEASERQFPTWSMGFQNLDDAPKPANGYSSFMSDGTMFSETCVSEVTELLDFFKLNS